MKESVMEINIQIAKTIYVYIMIGARILFASF